MHVDQAYKPTTVVRFDSELFQPLIRYKYSYLYTSRHNDIIVKVQM